MTHPVDAHVGKRIKQLRWLRGLTQQQLAQAIGVKFQQLQKYETGANRVSASRLWQLSEALQTPVSFFFDRLPAEGARNPAGFQETELLYERDSLELVRAYNGLTEELRCYVLDLLKAFSGNAGTRPSAGRLKRRAAAKTGQGKASKKTGKHAGKSTGKSARKTARR